MKKITITHRDIRARDENMVRIIQGVTKAGIHKNHKRDASRKACRGKYHSEE